MDGKAITEQLEKLHGTLADTASITDKDRELLKQLAADIQALLGDSEGAAGPKHESMAARVSEAVRLFEVEHPEITTLLAGVGKALGDMGI